MSAESKNERTLFLTALEINNRAERNAYLKDACGNDKALLTRVKALLQVEDINDDFLKAPMADPEITLEDAPVLEVPGTVIGRYKLLEKIGEGGMATVYMAEQDQPLRRQVALKIIKLGMDTKQVIVRFEVERQALAMMEHPNIAQVYDAGITEKGRPYFVMELVKGVSITDYCDKHNLSTKERLGLFIQVCNAIQHAHQKGIIHRDIKPSNIMITHRDGRPVPKVIDFGIAKATTQRLTEKTLFTRYAQLIGTPEYMSPEQAEFSELDVDTRTDIYSLGVLLYELLTGDTPFGSDYLRNKGYAEIQRIILEEEPTKPSTKLSGLGETLAEVARQHKTSPEVLQKLVRGDLDWIVMKALDKDRGRRYATTLELAGDIERNLNNEPVLAAAPSRWYKLRKFIRRNRVSVSFAASVATLIVAGFIVSTVLYFRAEQARKDEGIAREQAERQTQIAQAVNDFLNKDLLTSIKPEKAQGREVTVIEVLNTASEKIEGKFADDPLIEAAIRKSLGETYRSLGKYPATEKHYQRAFELRRDQLGEEDASTLGAMENLGNLYVDQGRYEEAEPLLLKIREIRSQKQSGEDNPSILSALENLAILYARQGRYKEAEPYFEKILEIRRRTRGEEHPSTLTAMNNLAVQYKLQGRYKEAEELNTKLLEIKRRELGEEHPDTLNTLHNLAGLYKDQGRYNKAESFFRNVLEIRRRVLGEDHPRTLATLSDLAVLYSIQARYRESEPLHVKVLEIERRVLGEEHPNTLKSISNLALLYYSLERYEEAEPLCTQALEVKRRVLGEEHPDTLDSMNNLALLYKSTGRYEQAESLYAKTLEISRRVLGEDHPNTLRSMNNLALLYKQMARYEEAEALYVKTLEIRRRILGEDHPDTLSSMNNLALLYKKIARYEEAESLYVKILDIQRRVLGEEHVKTLKAMNRLAWLWATCPQAEVRDGTKAVEYATRVCELTDYKDCGYIDTLAAAYAKTRDFNAAIMWQKKAIELLPEEAPASARNEFEARLKLYQSGKPFREE